MTTEPHVVVPAGSAIISPEAMFNELRATHDAVGRIENSIATTQKDQGKTIDDHEGRIRSIEQWRWKSTGVAATVALFTGVASGYFTNLITR